MTESVFEKYEFLKNISFSAIKCRPSLKFLETFITIGDDITVRSSHQRCSVKKGVLRNFAKFTGKHLCQSLSFNKFADLRPATLFKKRLWHRYFPVNFAKFLRTPFLQNTSGRLLLYCAVYLA